MAQVAEKFPLVFVSVCHLVANPLHLSLGSISYVGVLACLFGVTVSMLQIILEVTDVHIPLVNFFAENGFNVF